MRQSLQRLTYPVTAFVSDGLARLKDQLMSLTPSDLRTAKNDALVYLRSYIVEATREYNRLSVPAVRHYSRGSKRELSDFQANRRRLILSCESLQQFSHRNAMLRASTSASAKIMLGDAQAVVEAFDKIIKGFQSDLQEELVRQGIEETKPDILQADSVRRYGFAYTHST